MASKFVIHSVSSTSITIEVINPSEFKGEFNLGSFVKIPYKNVDEKYVIGVVDNYRIKTYEYTDASQGESTPVEPSFLLDLSIAGTIIYEEDNIVFERGSYGITLPPNNGIELLSTSEIEAIFKTGTTEKDRFCFSNLRQLNGEVSLPLNGNKFFNKHFSIVGSTGSGKSHTLAKLLQTAIDSKDGDFSLNNSHIVLFDIHGEYKSAFLTRGKHLDVSNLVLPYWLLNSEELEELFMDTEANDHNQRNVFKQAVIESKRKHFTGDLSKKEKIHYDSPLKFDIQDILKTVVSRNEEMVEGANPGKEKAGPLNGKLSNFISRLEAKLNDKRLDFLIGEQTKAITFLQTINNLISYDNTERRNITVIDLSGIPFEVLSITVSLISRILFDFGYYNKKVQDSEYNCPLLLVYEEAHKYVPKSDLKKYRASKESIERIAKEGRKYGVTLGIISQRPSEISETIFSQCNNFVIMRLTNPDDQAYIKRLLPDTLGKLTENLSSMSSGEALVIGDSIAIPSLAKIHLCNEAPSSSDIKYYEIWKEEWKDLLFPEIEKLWVER